MFKNTQKYYHPFLFCFVITSVWCAFVFFSFALIYKLDPAALGEKLLTVFYRPHYNNCTFGNIEGANVTPYIYCIIVISTISIHCFRAKIFKPQPPAGLMHILKQVTFATFCIILALQITGQVKHLAFEHKNYAIRPADERYPGSLRTLYDCGTFFRKILPGKHSAKFISDMDISREPGMFMHRAIAYYLYPIDIRNIRQEPDDSLVIINKNNPAQSIPDNFRILGTVNQKHFLAIKLRDNE